VAESPLQAPGSARYAAAKRIVVSNA